MYLNNSSVVLLNNLLMFLEAFTYSLSRVLAQDTHVKHHTIIRLVMLYIDIYIALLARILLRAVPATPLAFFMASSFCEFARLYGEHFVTYLDCSHTCCEQCLTHSRLFLAIEFAHCGKPYTPWEHITRTVF
jgi:hypothetical protein